MLELVLAFDNVLYIVLVPVGVLALLVKCVDKNQPEAHDAEDINLCMEANKRCLLRQAKHGLHDIVLPRLTAIGVFREVILSHIAVENYITNLALGFVSEDGDLVRLVELVVLERQVVEVLTFFCLADGQPVHDLLIFFLGRVANPESCHDVTEVFVIVRYDGLDEHTRFVVH